MGEATKNIGKHDHAATVALGVIIRSIHTHAKPASKAATNCDHVKPNGAPSALNQLQHSIFWPTNPMPKLRC